ncbi:hypothetical protein Bca4012_065187 [Brassica carinata]
MQREVEDVEAEDDDGGDDPKTLDFTGLAKRGYILASEAVLKEICTREEFELIKKSSRTLAQEVAGAELTDKDDSDSFGGSSSHRLEVQEPPFVGGVISLDDVHSEEEPKGS